MKTSTLNYLVVIGLVLTISLMIYALFVLNQEGNQCLKNPLKFAAQKLSDSSGYDFIGSGTFRTSNSPIVNFNQYEVTVDRLNGKYNRNLSLLNFSLN